jgi:glycerol-3-phosphate dehydrogenase (NAD(P)+)
MNEVPIEKGRIGVIGAGSWGTTLANLLGEKGLAVHLWVFEEELFQAMQRKRENEFFLPGIALSDNIQITHSLKEAFTGKDTLICAVPSHAVREVFSKGRPYLREETLIISATKGLEDETRSTVSQVLKEILGPTLRAEIACLSGPSFAREVACKFPTAVTASAILPEAARRAQILLARPYFRIYTNPDVMGVELGGATKNVMAIAAGASDGLGFGHSSRSALITRGLAEMTRLGVKMGADARTFFGLAGLGDLVLTCTGSLSRNRTVGLELGQGRKLKDILGGMRMVAEGIRTTKALQALAREKKVEMPITEKVYEILYEGKDPREAVSELMSRDPRSEQEGP